MSQAKVDKHKQEKYNRKKNVKKRNFKKIAAYVVATLIGYSVAIDTGLYTPATTTQGSTLSKEAIESLRQQLIKNGDSNVQGKTSDASTEAATTATSAETSASK